jgi:hypothetical protein
VIPPRRAEATDDLELVPGLLGLVALAEEARAIVRELADDGTGAVTNVDRRAGGVDDDLLDAMLGLAALARAIDDRVPSIAGAAAPDVRETRDSTRVVELLR